MENCIESSLFFFSRNYVMTWLGRFSLEIVATVNICIQFKSHSQTHTHNPPLIHQQPAKYEVIKTPIFFVLAQHHLVLTHFGCRSMENEIIVRHILISISIKNQRKSINWKAFLEIESKIVPNRSTSVHRKSCVIAIVLRFCYSAFEWDFKIDSIDFHEQSD